MDSLKAKIDPVDQSGHISSNEAKDLVLFLYNGADLEAISAGTPTWETAMPAEDGTVILIGNGQHTVNDDGVDAALLGKLTIAITAAQIARLRRGREVPFAVKRTVGSVVKTYWGSFDEVREAII